MNLELTLTKDQLTTLKSKIPLACQIPENGWVTNLPTARRYGIPEFSGDKATAEIPFMLWLDKIIRSGREEHLSHSCFTDWLIRHATGSCSSILVSCIRASLSVEDILRILQIKFANLCTPEQARALLHSLVSKPGESIPQLAERIQELSIMATRLEKFQVAELALDLSAKTLKALLRPEVLDDILKKEYAHLLAVGRQPTLNRYVAWIMDPKIQWHYPDLQVLIQKPNNRAQELITPILPMTTPMPENLISKVNSDVPESVPQSEIKASKEIIRKQSLPSEIDLLVPDKIANTLQDRSSYYHLGMQISSNSAQSLGSTTEDKNSFLFSPWPKEILVCEEWKEWDPGGLVHNYLPWPSYTPIADISYEHQQPQTHGTLNQQLLNEHPILGYYPNSSLP